MGNIYTDEELFPAQLSLDIFPARTPQKINQDMLSDAASVQRRVRVGRSQRPVVLERAFWVALERMAIARNISIDAIVQIAASMPGTRSLATRLRIYVLENASKQNLHRITPAP